MSAQIMVSQSALLHHQRLSQSPSPPPASSSSSSSIRRAHSAGSGGILLNSQAYLHRPHPLRQTSSASTSPTTSTHPTTTNSSSLPRKSASAGSGPSSRSIRFAPLPDPRRAVALTETGDVVPIIDSPCSFQGVDDDDADCQQPVTPLLPSTPSWIARAPTPAFNDGSGTGTDTGDVASIGSSTIRDSDSKKRRWTKKLLGPLLTSGRSSSLSPRTANFDAESPKQGGSGLGMWKSSSKDSTGSGVGLWRTASRESTSSIGSNAVGDGPLGRRLSSGSASGRPDRASIGSKTPTLPKGRMLNGRVYGVGGGAARNFQTPSSKQVEEPTFVEWGYGGMGSNTATPVSPAADYKKLAGASTVEDDDGSGMGWVRRRREARERAAREAEDKAKAEVVTPSSETSASETEECNDSSPGASSASSTTDVTSSENATPDESSGGSGQTIELPEIAIHPHTPTTPERPSTVKESHSMTPTQKDVLPAEPAPVQDDTTPAEPSSPPAPTSPQQQQQQPGSPTKPHARPPPIHIPDVEPLTSGIATPTKQRPGLPAHSPHGDEMPMIASAIHVPTLQQQELERQSADPEHVYKTVLIPVPHHHHHHHPHRGASVDVKVAEVGAILAGEGMKTPTMEKSRASAEIVEVVIESPTSSPTTSSRSSMSGDERERDEEDEEDDDDDDDEEDEEEIRATSLGAGVEKVSKHKD